MILKNPRIYGVLILATLFAVFVTACGSGGGGSNNSGGTTYLGTQSPGDVWTWTLDNNNNFSAVNMTLSNTYSGTYTTLSSGFLKLSVTVSSDPAVIATLDVPAIAYAFEVPGTALIVKPAGADSDVIVAAAQGTCPTADASYNWTVMPSATWDSTTDEAYGVSTSTVTGSNFDFVHNLYQLDGTLMATSSDAGSTCADGLITQTGDPLVVGLTPSGFLIGDNGPNEGGFMGMTAPAADVDLSATALAGKEFRGVLFRNGSTGDDTTLIWGRPNATTGTILDGGTYINDDVEAGVENTEVTVTFGTQPSPGVVNAVLDPLLAGLVSEDFTIMVNEINGKYFIFGISTVEGNATEPYNLIFIEQ